METTLDKLTEAVIEQLGCEPDELDGTMSDIANHGANAGWGGFTYYSDTCAFFESHKREIVELAKEYAEQFGQDVISMIAGFNCLTDDSETRDEIGRCIYGTPSDDDTQVPNALAWFALEEVARAYDENN